jgi:hypothetical protein
MGRKGGGLMLTHANWGHTSSSVRSPLTSSSTKSACRTEATGLSRLHSPAVASLNPPLLLQGDGRLGYEP